MLAISIAASGSARDKASDITWRLELIIQQSCIIRKMATSFLEYLQHWLTIQVSSEYLSSLASWTSSQGPSPTPRLGSIGEPGDLHSAAGIC